MKFSMNNPVMEYIDTAAHFIALNFIFFICCIPIITIGPAVTALYQVLLKEARKEHGYIIRRFFKYFKESFVQSVLTFILFAIVLFMLCYSLVFWSTLQTTVSMFAAAVSLVFIIFITAGLLYVFPLMARFDNSFKKTIFNAFYIAMTHRKATLLIFLIHLTFISLFYLFAGLRVFLLFLGFSFVHFTCAYIFTKVFKNYEPEQPDSVNA